LPKAPQAPIAILLTGVCGTGKTTIGKALAMHLGIAFLDADDYHPAANLEKMAAGIPLNDADRSPWLAAIANRIHEPESFVLACSALKETYRAELRFACTELINIHLSAPKEILHARLLERTSHFMPATLLDSQLEILETPSTPLIIDTAQSIQTCVQQILEQLAMTGKWNVL
jgi:gluconokinase